MQYMSENLHSGHRQRMLDKFLKSPDTLADYEFIEILLYSVLPRVNTNTIAHRLIRTFGSLKRLFDASPEELMSVEGIGKSAAAQIILFGRLMKTIKEDNTPKEKFYSFEVSKEDFINYFPDQTYERLILILLDNKERKITEIVFTNKREEEVKLELNEIAKTLAINRPTYVIALHNHPSGSLIPSLADDRFTANLYMICSLQGITLRDHVIVAKNNAMSYFTSGKLEQISDTANLKQILNTIEDL